VRRRRSKPIIVISGVDHSNVADLAETAIRLISELANTVTEMNDVLHIVREP
jgi:hypothetical protein